MKRPYAKKPQSGINVTPYIDILLVLLIIFMVMQPITNFELSSRLPQQPEPSPPIPQGTPIVLTVGADYSLTLNGEQLQFSGLGRRLWEVFSPRREKVLFVKGARELAYGTVVRAVDIAKGAGVQEVALLTTD